MSALASLISLAFILKITCVILLALILRKRCNSLLEAVVASWTLVFALMIGGMLFLSFFNALNGTNLIIIFGIVILSLLLIMLLNKEDKKIPTDDYNFLFMGVSPIILILIIVIFIILFYRSLYFFDTTWDALVYELPKIALFSQRMSLFIFEPTKVLNIFSNEWNGELNSLYYSLIANNDQATSFGNVEIWLYLVIVFAWLSSLFSVKPKYYLLVGFVMGTLPVSLGLSMTVKGDLLSFVALSLTIGWFIRIHKDGINKFYLVMVFVSLGILGGSKITVVPTVGLLYLIIIVYILIQKNLTYKTRLNLIILGSFGFLIGVSRFLVNLYFYNDPFKRVAGERAILSVDNIISNLIGLKDSIFGIFYSPIYTKEIVWVLNKSMGYLGVILLISPYFIYHAIKLNKTKNIVLALTYVSVFVGFIFVFTTTTWHPWSFRYFAPYLFLLFSYLIVMLLKVIPKSRVIVVSFIVISLLHVSIMLQKGETRPLTYQNAAGSTQIERKLALHQFLFEEKYGIKNNSLFYNGGGEILIYNDVNTPIYPFFGLNNNNRVELVDSPQLLVDKLLLKKYDAIVITDKSFPLLFEKDILIHGFIKEVDTDRWIIYKNITK